MPTRKTLFKKNKRVEVSVSKTINLGNYESVKIHAGCSEDIPENIEYESAYEDLWNTAMNEILKLEIEIAENQMVAKDP